MKITGKSGMVSVYSSKKFSTIIGAKVTLLQLRSADFQEKNHFKYRENTYKATKITLHFSQ